MQTHSETLIATPWTTGTGHEGFISLKEQGQSYVELLSNPDAFSVTQRVGAYGPVAIAEFGTDTEMEIHCGSQRSTYRINVPRVGRLDSTYRGSSLAAGPGTAVLYQPEGDAASRCAPGSHILSLRIERNV